MKVSIGVFQNYLINLKRESKRAQKMGFVSIGISLMHKSTHFCLLWACLENWSTEYGIFNFIALKCVHILRIRLESK